MTSKRPPFALAAMCLASTLVGCERRSDVITETDPFVTVEVPTPQASIDNLLKRAEQFATSHNMRVEVVDGHFAPTEYSLSLVRPDFNIMANNVGKGSRTVVRAYTVGAPSEEHREATADYLCTVMLQGCR